MRWAHWFLEYCPKCDWNASQSLVCEETGEDCKLFDKISQYRILQSDPQTQSKCSCGTVLIPTYRHGIADCNILVDANEKYLVAPLLPGQEHGTYLKAIEYDLIKSGLMVFETQVRA